MSVKARAGQGDARSGRSHGNARLAPVSLVDYALARGYCSVTDLVSPIWCEYAFQYNLLGLSHLPLSQRPEEIATPQGNIVKPNIEVAQQREKILTAGREVHKRLEKEIHPVRVHIETTTKEDAWGLRLLQLITGLRVLLDSGCCRELPVFGFVEGQLVFGVIDEIKIHNGKTDSHGKQKKYSSQEEWKRSASQQKKVSKVDSSQTSLAAFLPGISTIADEHHQEPPRLCTFGFVVEDAKTRLSMSMPDAKDQIQSRLQCMLYKRLLDGLLAGLTSNLKGGLVDEYATPLSVDTLLCFLDLDGCVGLSDVFIRDAEDLCNSFEIPLQITLSSEGRWTCNLYYLFGILTTTLDGLVAKAHKGAPNKESFHVIQDELRLTYRRREGKWSKREKNQSPQKEKRQRVQPGKQAKNNDNADIRQLLKEEIEDLDEEAQVELALQISMGETDKKVEEEKLADQHIPLPSPSPRKAKRDIIIGTVKFPHDGVQLQEHLIDVMTMWKGERPLRGVTVEQTWRCNHCEYLQDCEWRQDKAEEGLQMTRDKKLAEEEQEMWSQMDDLPDDMEW